MARRKYTIKSSPNIRMFEVQMRDRSERFVLARIGHAKVRICTLGMWTKLYHDRRFFERVVVRELELDADMRARVRKAMSPHMRRHKPTRFTDQVIATVQENAA